MKVWFPATRDFSSDVALGRVRMARRIARIDSRSPGRAILILQPHQQSRRLFCPHRYRARQEAQEGKMSRRSTQP